MSRYFSSIGLSIVLTDPEEFHLIKSGNSQLEVDRDARIADLKVCGGSRQKMRGMGEQHSISLSRCSAGPTREAEGGVT
jgi:hypothetical protein